MTAEVSADLSVIPGWDAVPTCELDKINPEWGVCHNEATLVAEIGHSMNGCTYSTLTMCEDCYYSVTMKAVQHPIPYVCSGCMGPVDKVTDLIFKVGSL